MKKVDVIISPIIGFIIGAVFFGVLKNIGFKIPYSWLMPFVMPPLSLLGMFVVFTLGKKFLFIYQAGKFALSGALTTFVDLGVLNGLIWISGIAAGPLYPVFKSISFIIAVIHSYIWNKYWTFERRKEPSGPKEFSKFLLTATVGFIINVGTASSVVNVIGPQFGIGLKLWANIGAFVATFVGMTWNFIGSKFWVFKHKSEIQNRSIQ